MAPYLEVLQDENANDFLSYEKPKVADSFDFERKNLAVATDLVRAALVTEVNNIDHDVCDAGDEDSFFVADLGEVYRSYQLWMEKLPQVHPHYAVKCNTDVEVVKLLGSLGVNFDCASKTEIDTVLGLGFDSLRIVYANPCKTNSFIRHARNVDVNLTTVDNGQELHKLKKFHPECGILIRIATDDSTAQCQLSTKFGCSLNCAVDELLPLCKLLELNVAGVAFHVGSGAKDFDSIYRAVKEARYVFDRAEQLGMRMTVLDIGGGFERESFDKSSEMVNLSLNKFFPSTYTEQNGIRFIAEPGRFMVANSFTLATHIIARRDLNVEGMEAMIYINDGVYGNLNCILFDHQHPTAKVLKHDGEVYFEDDTRTETTDAKRKEFSFSIWGPTCDGLDCVSTNMILDANVQVGDWLYFSNLGAYTSAATTSFNGFSSRANVKYVMLATLP
ncbi:CIC11C00000005497 [Sungouiella intermedia]|uniref:Ornithine decarboxylase n=1 Tax=Sungouiella intermedia TaxID=45354 RepID=A0A1L0DAE8_9ASCO|nr:CIC11C00000005497 [[Candida] intermedia]